MANTKNIGKHFEGGGEMDYDFVNDILFFKAKNREYEFSLELHSMVIDIDDKELITGLQIFGASEFLGVKKSDLRQIAKFRFEAKIDDKTVDLRLFYQIMIRTQIIEKNPIIIQDNTANLPSSRMIVVS